MEKYYTAEDLVFMLDSKIKLRTAQRWLEGHETATNKGKPKEYSLQTIKNVINEHRKDFNLGEIPLEYYIHRAKIKKDYEENFEKNMQELDELHQESEMNPNLIADTKWINKQVQENSIKIMLKALLAVNNLVFDENQLKTDLEKIEEEERIFPSEPYFRTLEYFAAKERLENEGYIKKA